MATFPAARRLRWEPRRAARGSIRVHRASSNILSVHIRRPRGRGHRNRQQDILPCWLDRYVVRQKAGRDDDLLPRVGQRVSSDEHTGQPGPSNRSASCDVERWAIRNTLHNVNPQFILIHRYELIRMSQQAFGANSATPSPANLGNIDVVTFGYRYYPSFPAVRALLFTTNFHIFASEEFRPSTR